MRGERRARLTEAGPVSNCPCALLERTCRFVELTDGRNTQPPRQCCRRFICADFGGRLVEMQIIGSKGGGWTREPIRCVGPRATRAPLHARDPALVLRDGR